ncbi:MAG: hypothetical protein ACE5EL_08635 [Anaerolineae bacterium]
MGVYRAPFIDRDDGMELVVPRLAPGFAGQGRLQPPGPGDPGDGGVGRGTLTPLGDARTRVRSTARSAATSGVPAS